MFVYNLPPTCEDNMLYALFGPFGNIDNVKIIRDKGSQMCKGYAFVNMTDMGSAQAAITQLNGYKLGDKYLQVSLKK